jgi:hypothetical protein
MHSTKIKNEMKIIITLILTFAVGNIFGQQSKQLLEKIENPENSLFELKKENFKAKYLKYDFSTLLTPKQDFLGFIGNDFQRIKIYFASISKDEKKHENYFIKGVSVVGTNVCEFKGEIKIVQIREYKTNRSGLDSLHNNASIVSQGILIGNYEFKENSEQFHSGIFKGIVTVNWYLDKLGILHYHDIESFSNNYRNNQYVGTWMNYENNDVKICNWGEYRIPFPEDLHIGTDKFSPNKK